MKQILIIGGGAGGLELAANLGRKFGKTQKATITLVDASPIHLWKPLLHEVAAGTLNAYEDELNFLAYASEHHFQFCMGTMQGLDRTSKEVILAKIVDENEKILIPERRLKYDILVIAVGSLSNDFKIPGVKEHSLFLDSTEQAKYFHDHFLKTMMQWSYEPTQAEPRVIGIIGGGATGIELAAELHYAIRQMNEYGYSLDPKFISLVIVEAAPRILASLPERFSNLAQAQLDKLAIKVMTNERVTEVTPEGIKTLQGGLIPLAMTIWAAGIKAPDFLKNLDGLPVNNINQLIVKQTLQTSADDHIFAFGDCAYCLQSNSENAVPPRAQAAHQQAKHLVKAINALMQQQPLPLYHYQDYGSLVTLSHYETVGNLMGKFTSTLHIEGKLARMAYLSLYKMHQVALFGYWRVAMFMLADLITRRIRPRLKLH
jgi:NADH dehydrogenase